jgi:hypothetical protein
MKGFFNDPGIASCRSRTSKTHTRSELKPADSTRRVFSMMVISLMGGEQKSPPALEPIRTSQRPITT